jgi:TRAP-type C4-dicarboxylate transport system substrate-binding protein
MKGKPMLHRFTRRSMLRVATGAAVAPAIIGRAQAAPLELKLSTSQSNDPKYSSGRVYYDFLVKRLSENNLDQAIKIQFFPDNQLGQEIDVANSVKLGAIDLMSTGTPIWANLIPTLGVMDLGYLFSSFAQQTKALDAGVGAKLAQMVLTGANTHIVGWAYDFGPRCIYRPAGWRTGWTRAQRIHYRRQQALRNGEIFLPHSAHLYVVLLLPQRHYLQRITAFGA